MVPKITQVDTDQASRDLKTVSAGETQAKPPRQDPLRPEVRKAFEETWASDQAAYRYLAE